MSSQEDDMKPLRCVKCGHEWYRRSPIKPKVCPKCKTTWWEKPRPKKHKIPEQHKEIYDAIDDLKKSQVR